jgi:hypothetical protein
MENEKKNENIHSVTPIKVFKYNEDDILEVLLEYLAEKNGFNLYSSKGILLGLPGKDLRLIAVLGDLEDETVDYFDLDEADQSMDYNGTHPPAYTYQPNKPKE